MDRIEFGLQLILRAAEKSYKDFDYENLRHEINDIAFQSAIFFASESLFRELEKKHFLYDELSPRTLYSLKKYYNRFCFRSTPFGMFAATGTLLWEDDQVQTSCVIAKKISVLPNFQILELIKTLIADGPQTKYFLNNTIFGVKPNRRYLSCDFSNDSQSLDFKMLSFQTNRFIEGLFKFTAGGQRKEAVIKYCINAGYSQDDSHDFVERIIESGLLYWDLQPNDVGEYYLNRLNRVINSTEQNVEALELWSGLNKRIRNYEESETEELREIARINWPGNFKHIQNKFYVNTSIEVKPGLHKVYQQTIRDGLKCLNKLTQHREFISLTEFKRRFKMRFDGQQIQLLHALDPETGVGYLSDALKKDNLLNQLVFKEKQINELVEWHPIHQMLFKKLHSASAFQPVFINDQDLQDLPGDTAIFPPSLSVHFSIFDELISIENAGGSSATALTGRFTLTDPAIKNYNLKIAEIEQNINPSVIFAEISCLTQGAVANVCTRERIYPYEIPLLTYSTSDPSYVIQPNDLFVSVVDDQIILISQRLKKIVVPRFSSAYNYRRHDLSVFKFLCDLQYQSVKSDFNFDIRKVFPGLDYYPRIVYKKCILNRASWMLNEQQITILKGSENIASECTSLLDQLSVPKLFMIVEGDNTLTFDRSVAEQLELFIQIIKPKKSVVLKEVLTAENELILDKRGNPLNHELVASAINLQPTYSGFSGMKWPGVSPKERYFLPGDNWFYYKIYCNAQRTDETIGQDIYKVINQLKKTDVLRAWYFIRYRDPEDHIRLRIKASKENAHLVISAVNNIIGKKRKEGLISAVSLETYQREIERYGARNIEHIENIFEHSSDLALRFFHSQKAALSEGKLLEMIIVSVDLIIDQYDTNVSLKQIFAEHMCKQFGAEFGVTNQFRNQLDKKYRDLKTQVSQSLGKSELQKKMLTASKGYCDSIRRFLGAQAGEYKVRLLADIIHMHLNRMFFNEQRKQEYVIYYLLWKYYRSDSNNRKSN